MKESIYYIGFNANNAICNDQFFKGSITLYPTKEKGNIYFSDQLLIDTKSDAFLENYKQFIHSKIKEINNGKFICFNEKTYKLCQDIDVIRGNDKSLVDFLNDKFATRNFVKDCVPILEYSIFNELDYEDIKNTLGSKFVVQGKNGSGGDNTYLVTNKNELNIIPNGTYCISKYVKHLPLNITLIIGDEEIIFLPISIQLIMLTDNKFKYVGGDFNYINNIDKKIIDKINDYSQKIGTKVKNKGYRGILGIDYILTENNEIIFMEINPRFQASSFLISLNLFEQYSLTIAELHYLAITNQHLPKIDLKMNESFVNCNSIQAFNNLENYKIIDKGYFKDNPTSIYRKVFNYSILNKELFEKID